MEETLPRRGHKNCCRHNLHSQGDVHNLAKQGNENRDGSVELGQGEGVFHLLNLNQIPDNILRPTAEDYRATRQDKQSSQIVQTDPVTFLDASYFKDFINNNNHTNASVQATEDSQCRPVFWRYFWYTIQAIVIILFMSYYHTCVLSFCEHVGSSGLVTTVAEYITPQRRIEQESIPNKILFLLYDITCAITEFIQKVFKAI